MIYITGDTHCPTGMDKLNETNFPQQKHMTKKDYVIICGDFGDIWSAKSNEQKDMLQWLSQRNFTTLFLDGNWENYGKLNPQTITRVERRQRAPAYRQRNPPDARADLYAEPPVVLRHGRRLLQI